MKIAYAWYEAMSWKSSFFPPASRNNSYSRFPAMWKRTPDRSEQFTVVTSILNEFQINPVDSVDEVISSLQPGKPSVWKVTLVMFVFFPSGFLYGMVHHISRELQINWQEHLRALWA